ncbi:MAG: glycosyltransferase family 2 protein [Lentisphaerae bacterium]|nr:glycosyltransferase family 2 protein [Lentisphaerota bacterium]
MTMFNQVPAYTVKRFGPKSTKYCIVPIVYNEGDKFLRQIDRMSANSALVDIVVAERRSTDGSTSPEVLKAAGVRTLLTTDEAGGARAIRMAFDYALRSGYEGVILIDGNGKDGVESIPQYVEKLDEGYDFVQGSRFMEGGVERNTPILRRIGIKAVMGPLIWLGSGFWYTDSTNGFRGYSRKLLTDPRIEPLRDCFVSFNLQYFLSVKAPKLRFRVVEIPVERVYPAEGPLPSKVVGFRRNFMAWWEMVLTVLGCYDPPKPG